MIATTRQFYKALLAESGNLNATARRLQEETGSTYTRQAVKSRANSAVLEKIKSGTLTIADLNAIVNMVDSNKNIRPKKANTKGIFLSIDKDLLEKISANMTEKTVQKQIIKALEALYA